jgi:hypothetical protein
MKPMARITLTVAMITIVGIVAPRGGRMMRK